MSYVLRQSKAPQGVRVRVRAPVTLTLILAREWARTSRATVYVCEGETWIGSLACVYYRVNKHGAVFAPHGTEWRAVH